MRCARCGGLMVHEKFEDLGGLGSSDHEYAGWRCINCGAIVDPVIAAHRHLTSQAAASNPALTPHEEASCMHTLCMAKW
jgi:DNA-directed RNA polymerase subunit RPC12/RpoP